MTSAGTDTSVVVIGAGQAGLSVSYYLQRLGLDAGNEFIVLDRGPGTGGAWQFRWEALRIGSAHRINDLPGMSELDLSFETADRKAPAKDVVADYYARYEQHFGFQVVRPAAVTRVDREDDHLVVVFDDGHGEQRVTTEVVINATGTWGAPFIPWYPGMRDFAGRHVHTTEYTDAADFAGQRVIVVGGGTSAIGFLLELEGVAEQVTWVSRREIDWRDDGELSLEDRRSAVEQQDEAARAGKALPSIVSGTGVPRTRRIQAGIERGALLARPMFSSIEEHGVRWSNGAFLEADAIVWATGFRPELRHLAPLKLREKEGGIVVAAGSSWKEPRVFFAGYGPQASTVGANRAGRTIARQAIATLSRLARARRTEEPIYFDTPPVVAAGEASIAAPDPFDYFGDAVAAPATSAEEVEPVVAPGDAGGSPEGAPPGDAGAPFTETPERDADRPVAPADTVDDAGTATTDSGEVAHERIAREAAAALPALPAPAASDRVDLGTDAVSAAADDDPFAAFEALLHAEPDDDER